MTASAISMMFGGAQMLYTGQEIGYANPIPFCWSCKDKEEPKEEPVVIEDPGVSGYQQYGVPMDSVPQGRDIQMYEVNLRAFSSSGDLDGVTAQLDRLDSLGINVIWLMPIHPIGSINSVNSPYSVKNYLEVCCLS